MYFNNNYLIKIYAINSLDCYHLKLIDKVILSVLLKKLNDLSLHDNCNEESIRDIFREIADSIANHQDPRKNLSQQLINNSSASIMTVMSFYDFFYYQPSIASKVLNENRENPEFLFQPDLTELGKDKIIRWFERISSIVEKKEEPLVFKSKTRIWVTTQHEHAATLNANQLRSRLGLVHLPKKQQNDYSSKVLIKVKLSFTSLHDLIIKRACMLDMPSSRFRALSIQDANYENSPNEFGYAVDIDNNYADGFNELVLYALDNINSWELGLVSGLLDQPHPNKEQHQHFYEHLSSMKPTNSAFDYRYAIDEEFKRFL